MISDLCSPNSSGIIGEDSGNLGKTRLQKVFNKRANNCSQCVLEKRIYFRMWFSPHFQFFLLQ